MGRPLLWAAAILLCAAVGAAAHHSFAAEFDANRRLTLRGTVVQMEWVNPHCSLWIDVTNPHGQVEHWVLELGPPNALLGRGLRKTMLVPGVIVTVTAYPSKDGRRTASLETLTMPDGTVLAAGSRR